MALAGNRKSEGKPMPGVVCHHCRRLHCHDKTPSPCPRCLLNTHEGDIASCPACALAKEARRQKIAEWFRAIDEARAAPPKLRKKLFRKIGGLVV